MIESGALDAVFKYIDEHAEETVADLQALCRHGVDRPDVLLVEREYIGSRRGLFSTMNRCSRISEFTFAHSLQRSAVPRGIQAIARSSTDFHRHISINRSPPAEWPRYCNGCVKTFTGTGSATARKNW